jgi:hypothetical protein
MDYDVAVEEFTPEGKLIPSDRITWTGSEDPEEGLESQGWTLGLAHGGAGLIRR